MSTSNIVNIGGFVIIVALIGVITALALNSTISGADALAFLGPIVAAAIGIIGHALGVQAGTAATATGAASATGQAGAKP